MSSALKNATRSAKQSHLLLIMMCDCASSLNVAIQWRDI